MPVYAKLMEARIKLHGQEIKKSGRNTFANYSYMELADFLIPTQTIFAGLGLCGIVSFAADLASLTIIDTEDGTQHTITSPMGSAALKGCHEVQNIGAVETYQRRYLWMAALEIVEHDALDSSPPIKGKGKADEPRGVAAAVLAVSEPLTAEVKASLASLAESVSRDYEAYGAQAAWERIDEQGLEDIEKIYLSTLMGSTMRNQIKAYHLSLTQKATA